MSALDDDLGRFRCWLCTGVNVTHLHRRTVIVSTCRDCGARRKTARSTRMMTCISDNPADNRR